MLAITIGSSIKNWESISLPYVQMSVNGVVSRTEMKELFTEESALLQERLSFQFILRISHFQCTKTITGGPIIGILGTMGETSILVVPFLNSFMSFSTLCLIARLLWSSLR